MTPAAPHRYEPSITRYQITQIVAEMGEASINDIHKRLQIGKTLIQHYCNSLTEFGYLVKTRNGVRGHSPAYWRAGKPMASPDDLCDPIEIPQQLHAPGDVPSELAAKCGLSGLVNQMMGA